MNTRQMKAFGDELMKISSIIHPAVDLAGLGVLAVPSVKNLMSPKATPTEKNHAKYEIGGLGLLAGGTIHKDVLPYVRQRISKMPKSSFLRSVTKLAAMEEIEAIEKEAGIADLFRASLKVDPVKATQVRRTVSTALQTPKPPAASRLARVAGPGSSGLELDLRPRNFSYGR